jgi:hypothetical protein
MEDSSFAVLDLLHRAGQLAAPVNMVSRLRLDAALYKPAPPRQAHQMGRPWLRGHRLPNLTTVLNDDQTALQSLVLTGWFERTEHALEVCSNTAVWYHTGKPGLPIQWVLV